MSTPAEFWSRLPFLARLLVSATLALLIAGVAMIVLVTNNEAREIRDDLRAELVKELETMPGTLVEMVAIGDFASLQQQLDRYVRRPLIASLRFDDQSGIHLSSIDREIPLIVPAWAIGFFDPGEISGSTAVVIGGRKYGELHIRMTGTQRFNRAWEHLQQHLLILLLAIALDFIGIWLVLRHGLRPLDTLREGALQMAAGRMDVQLEVLGSPELSDVMVAFNRMSAALAVNDLQRRRQAEELDEQRRRLKDIIAGTHVGTWEWKVQSGETIFNERWAEIVGYSLAELQPISINTWVRLVHPDDLEQSNRALEQHFSGEQPYYTCAVRMRHKDGHWVWVLDRGRVAAWTADGKPLLMSGTHQDISQQKALEEELLQHRNHLEKLVASRTLDLAVAKEAAEKASRAKSTFLSMASHELRTPMNGVMGSIALAMRKTSEPQLLDYLNKADRASKHLLAIINDVLDLSRIESNRLLLEQTAFTLDTVMAHVRDAVEDSARLRDLSLSISLPPLLGATPLRGDPTRLAQVLTNLVGNAIKFTPHGGVRIEARVLQRDANGIQLRLEVIDSGIGIRSEDQARIFEPFEQADASTSRHFGGTGLGLALCRNLVEAMSGRIGVSSELGRGSTFWCEILFPTFNESRIGTEAPSETAGECLRRTCSGARLLVVEDEPLNQEIIQALLVDVGLHIECANDGQAAVERLRNEHYDLILMDMNMPRLGGIAATRQIRELPGCATTPIIALTANAFSEDRAACLDAGMNDHLGKPLAPETLYQTVLRWLNRSHEPSGADLPTAAH